MAGDFPRGEMYSGASCFFVRFALGDADEHVRAPSAPQATCVTSSGSWRTGRGGRTRFCIKMQRGAYCVCSLTFHARCWPGDVLSRAPLWCQDRRSLRRRSNNGCSKTQQVSSGNKFTWVGKLILITKFSEGFSSQYYALSLLFLSLPTSTESVETKRWRTRRVDREASLILFYTSHRHV